MNRYYRIISVVILGLLMTIIIKDIPIGASESIRPEIRALWVDAFRDGIKTPAQIDRLIQDALTANINTLIVQVRRRGDSYYNNSIEPRTEDPVLQPGFDGLQYLIDKAHANQLEVHAWLNTLVAWNSKVPPVDPYHVWNLHGPQTTGRDNWVSYYRTYDKTSLTWSDTVNSSYYLDPGHPDVLDYTTEVYLNVVRNYNVDGIHLDYSRYAGASWGYNPTSLDRYNTRYGTTGMPEVDDLQWAAWRREQTANLVRKIYLKAIAIKPSLKVSSAVITWGNGPNFETGWENSRAYTEVFQDWNGWLQEGIIDLVMPMNYFSESNITQQFWYDQWVEWEKDHPFGQQIVVGPGIFTNYIEHSLEQIRRALAPSALGNYAAGVGLFTYGATSLYSNNEFKESIASQGLPRQPHQYLPQTNEWFFSLLAKRGNYFDPVLNSTIATQPVFSTPATIPEMPWKTKPVNGYLMGTVTKFTGNKDHLKVSVDRVAVFNLEADFQNNRIHREVYTDGSGWFGLAKLPPGRYRVLIGEQPAVMGQNERFVTVYPGRVAEVNW